LQGLLGEGEGEGDGSGDGDGPHAAACTPSAAHVPAHASMPSASDEELVGGVYCRLPAGAHSY